MSDILSTMRSRLHMAQACYADSRESELDDLRFLAGSPDNNWQWPADVLSTRGALQGQTVNARPILTINKLPQHVRQVTNDQRQNRPGIKVIPVDDNADIEVAEVLEGMMRHIEYMSDADVAYDTACDNQVTYGEGYFRLLTDYCTDDSFEQDIRIGRIRNSFSVYMDPTIQDPTGSDAQWCFITQDLLKDEYARQFPKARPISSLMDEGVGDDSYGVWLTEDTVRIAEYFYCDYKSDTLFLFADGRSAFKDDPLMKVMTLKGEAPIKTRSVQRKSIKWIKTNGFEVLEEQDWPGKWIPVIRVVGNEFEVEGRIYLSGLVRNAKDAQRLYNYWTSQEAEMLALAPKAPFIGYGGQFEGYETQWKTANVQNWPYLEANPDVTDAHGTPLPLPQRAAPPLAQPALIQAKIGAADDIKATTGQYDPSLGAQSNETSGKAILARERQSDVGTYHYVDNLGRAIRHCGRQIIDLIPTIYDTQRIARIVGLDGDTEMVKVNPMQEMPVNKIRDQQTNAVQETIYNLSVGRYDVMVTTGPSYMTKRQEGAEWMAQTLQGNPEMWGVFGDLAVKSMDVHMAQEIGERLKRFIGQTNPNLLSEGDEDPALAAAQQQIEQMGQQLQETMGMLENMHNSIEAQEVRIKAFDAETKRISALQPALSEQQMQDIAAGTVDAAMATGDVSEGKTDVAQPTQ